MKFINPRFHGVIDYIYIATLALGPSLLNFAGIPAMLCYIFAVGVLALALLTKYPLGALKVIPFMVHGGMEFFASFVVMGSPWLFNFAGVEPARNFFLAAGGLLFLVWLFTDYKAASVESTIQMRQEEKERAASNR